MARQNASTGGGDTLGASPDYAKRHDIPSDDHPSRSDEGKPGGEAREDSEAATKALLAKHGPNVDLNAPDPVADKLAKDAAKEAKARDDSAAKAKDAKAKVKDKK